MENEALILDFLEWINEEPRPYDEVMSAWRTSCPRLTIWEDAIDAGFVKTICVARSANTVQITSAGVRFLNANNRGQACQPPPQ